nr:hypothetical protein [Vibrio diabolicus]
MELFQSHKIDLVLMDVQCQWNGFDASQRIKQLRLPFLSSHYLKSGAKRLELIAKLMDDRLEKPTTLNALQTVIKRWLQHEVLLLPTLSNCAKIKLALDVHY